MDRRRKPLNADIVPLTIGGTIAVVHLKRGEKAIIDAEAWDVVSRGRWHASTGGAQESIAYAASSVYDPLIKRSRYVALHRLVTNAPKGSVVDHVNGNGLDCRKSNLRVVTVAANRHNVHCRPRSNSGFHGVSRHKPSTKWQAAAKANGKTKFLGLFADRAEAARAYDRYVCEHRDEHATLNFADSRERFGKAVA